MTNYSSTDFPALPGFFGTIFANIVNQYPLTEEQIDIVYSNVAMSVAIRKELIMEKIQENHIEAAEWIIKNLYFPHFQPFYSQNQY